MNRFRKLGYIEYNGRIQVNRSLLNVVLHDQPFEQNAVSADLLTTPPGALKSAQRIAKAVNRINNAPDKHVRNHAPKR